MPYAPPSRPGRRSLPRIAAALLTLVFLPGSRAADPLPEATGPFDLASRVVLETLGESPVALSASTPPGTVQWVLVGEIDPEAVRARGGVIGTRAGGVMTVTAPLDRLEALAGIPGLERLSVARAVRPLSDVSVPETEADALWDGDGGTPPTYRGLTGRGVVIGIVDSGLDLGHADFCTPTGSTRILYAWDQTWAGSPPDDFAYGTEYTRNAIDAGQAGEFRDTDGHGTHVAGIAAGDGSATGEGQPAYRYVGVAPLADLIVVKTNFTDAGIIDGVSYVFNRAAALGKPAVVNLSIGTHTGGHDGSTAMDVALTALTGPGRLITAAAGNDGDRPVHARVDLASGATTTVEFEVPEYSTSTIFPESIFLEGWHDGDRAFRIRLTGPTGSTSGWVEPGATSGSVATAEGTCRIENGMTTNARGAKEVSVAVWRSGSTGTHPAPGIWTLTVTPAAGSSGRVDFWMTGWNLGSGDAVEFRNPDVGGTVSSPATADGVIATGAYATKRQWTNGTGGFSSFGNIPLGALAAFSSRCKRRSKSAAGIGAVEKCGTPGSDPGWCLGRRG